MRRGLLATAILALGLALAGSDRAAADDPVIDHRTVNSTLAIGTATVVAGFPDRDEVLCSTLLSEEVAVAIRDYDEQFTLAGDPRLSDFVETFGTVRKVRNGKTLRY